MKQAPGGAGGDGPGGVPPTTPAGFIGRYQILEKIGEGGMGSLYLARDPAIDRLVAIKLLRRGFDSPELRERFAREARAAGRLRHPNIVTIFDVGEHDGDPFIAMEFLAGETLHELVRGGARLSLARRLKLIEELCDGLAYAHRSGIIHRDIKPANLIVDAEGVLKILDFGIVRLDDAGATQAGVLVGTINYMSPEQLTGGSIDHRSDIFAVGLVAYELLSGRQAFPGTLRDGVLQKVLAVTLEPLPLVVPGIDPQVAAIVEQALQADPDRRYPDLARMRNDLVRVRKRIEAAEEAAADDGSASSGATAFLGGPGLPTPASGIPPTGDFARVTAAKNSPAVEVAAHAARGTRSVWSGVAAGVFVLVVALIAWNSWASRRQKEPEAAAVVKEPAPSLPPPALSTAQPSVSTPAAPAAPGSAGPALTSSDTVARAGTAPILFAGRGGTPVPRRIRYVEPIYPASVDARVEGDVVVELTIGRDGRVADARVTRSVSGLDQAALAAVRQWEFLPIVSRGEAVPVIYPVTVTFAAPAPAEAAKMPTPAAPQPAGPSPSAPPAGRQPQRFGGQRGGRPADQTEQTAIRGFLRHYEKAWASRRPEVVGRFQRMPASELERVRATLAGAAEYSMKITDTSITVGPDGRYATVTASVDRRVRGQAGAPQTTTVTNVFTLAKQQTGLWRIVEVR